MSEKIPTRARAENAAHVLSVKCEEPCSSFIVTIIVTMKLLLQYLLQLLYNYCNNRNEQGEKLYKNIVLFFFILPV